MESSSYHLLRLLRARPIGGSPLRGKHIRVCPAALRALGRLVGRQVPRPVSAATQLRRGLHSLSRAPGVDSCHPSPPLRATPGQGVNEAPKPKRFRGFIVCEPRLANIDHAAGVDIVRQSRILSTRSVDFVSYRAGAAQRATYWEAQGKSCPAIRLRRAYAETSPSSPLWGYVKTRGSFIFDFGGRILDL